MSSRVSLTPQRPRLRLRIDFSASPNNVECRRRAARAGICMGHGKTFCPRAAGRRVPLGGWARATILARGRDALRGSSPSSLAAALHIAVNLLVIVAAVSACHHQDPNLDS